MLHAYRRPHMHTHLGHEALLALGSLDEEERAAVGVQQDLDVEEDARGQTAQVEVVRNVLDDLEEEVALVGLAKLPLELLVY